ncbi:4a-hydroxytetrahydrobiopterin dehydratase [Streptomyces cavernicola]|uniref:Putative pterin-4-alpha-carbinolamine dehydratase n=1 Tax=Streptomyces cavernicola TaxID=3043613 RepID=A0ABT6SEW8_9ACTN|nr:4a-hydroxytetrahydrobiopterin dehydratase [Streptomyces sp. B-S-A6]MDI3406716.1 4a-hydroxytetrahydrobiopterin dehydratase [Streptomyces sp. B-S-A6]
MALAPLSQQEIDDKLAELPGWAFQGDKLTRSYRLGSHFAAAALVVHIAQVQDELDHHSDLVLGYHSVDLSVNTHSVGGAVTEKDFGLAGRVEALARTHGVKA